MPMVFDCEECKKRFYTDEDMIPHSRAIHTGYDDMDGYLVSCYLCEDCAEMARMEQERRAKQVTWTLSGGDCPGYEMSPATRPRGQTVNSLKRGGELRENTTQERKEKWKGKILLP